MHPKVVNKRESIRLKLQKWKEHNEEIQMAPHMRDLIHKQRNPDEKVKKFEDHQLAQKASARREKWIL
jgi:hypothetical protein